MDSIEITDMSESMPRHYTYGISKMGDSKGMFVIYRKDGGKLVKIGAIREEKEALMFIEFLEDMAGETNDIGKIGYQVYMSHIK